MLTAERMDTLRTKYGRREFYRIYSGDIVLLYDYPERRWIVNFKNVTWKFATTVAAVEQIQNLLMKRLSKRQVKDVHTEHCCLEHGCKYGDDDCSVTNYHQKQSFPCEMCDEYCRDY